MQRGSKSQCSRIEHSKNTKNKRIPKSNHNRGSLYGIHVISSRLEVAEYARVPACYGSVDTATGAKRPHKIIHSYVSAKPALGVTMTEGVRQ